MTRTVCRFAILTLCAAALLPATAAKAQWFGDGASRQSPPLYPYKPRPGQPYAVEVAPGTYVIHHPSARHAHPRIGRRTRPVVRYYRAGSAPPHAASHHATADEPLRRDARRAAPKVTTRRHYAKDARPRHRARVAPKRAAHEYPRTIHADAEITILGPERMSIRLVRKDGKRLNLKARARRAK